METEMITIPEEEYILLKKKAKIADDAIVQLKLGLDDLRQDKVRKF